MRIDGQQVTLKVRNISFVVRGAPIYLIKNRHDILKKPKTSSYAQPVWQKNRCSGPCEWKLQDGKHFSVDARIARTYLKRTPITTSNVYKVRSHMMVCSVRRDVVPLTHQGPPSECFHFFPTAPNHLKNKLIDIK